MRCLGLLGGMSWESSILYERLLNESIRERLGGVHSADLIVRSYDFATIERLQEEGRWDEAGELLAADAARLVAAGAEVIALCTNTMHKVAPAIEAAIDVPFVHLADATARAVSAAGVETVGLLGTRYTMEQDFYRDRLADHDLTVVVPEAEDRRIIDDIIFGELVRGVVDDDSRRRYIAIAAKLVAGGVTGIIAGCTEIELLLGPADVTVPYFPTTRLHVDALIAAALA